MSIPTSNTKSKFSFLLKFEDYWAIWLGAIILIFSMFVYFGNPPANMSKIIAESNATMQVESERAPFKTMAWFDANAAKTKVKGSSTPAAKAVTKYLAVPATSVSYTHLRAHETRHDL